MTMENKILSFVRGGKHLSASERDVFRNFETYEYNEVRLALRGMCDKGLLLKSGRSYRLTSRGLDQISLFEDEVEKEAVNKRHEADQKEIRDRKNWLCQVLIALLPVVITLIVSYGWTILAFIRSLFD